MLENIIIFISWLFCLYWIHRISHYISIIKNIHWDHHDFIQQNFNTSWHWSNLFLFNDTWKSTADLWITEVIPTWLFCYLTGYWWIFVFYYMWAAFIQESIEHNPKINLYPFLTSGKWHLQHHEIPNCNFGLITPIFDKVFQTEMKINK
jgi:lathosterol oxidase